MRDKKTTVVLGASDNPGRYSYLAVHRLRNHDHPVIAIGKKAGKVADVEIKKGPQPPEEGVDTVTLYLNPLHQKMYYDYIVSLKPRRIILIQVPKTMNWPF